MLLLSLLTAADAGAATPAKPFDFNGDGYGDLAVGAPLDDLSANKPNAGAVSVLYGSANGTTTAGNQLWTQDIAGIAGSAEPADRFGAAISSADFDRDGYADLAIGAPGEDEGANSTGVVHVIYGTKSGLESAGNQMLRQGVNGLNGKRTKDDAFGAALVAADFNADGFSDLVVGVPGKDVSGVNEAGAVHVIRGSSGGPTASGNRIWNQDSAGILDQAQQPASLSGNAQGFGRSLAAGRLDSDKYPDLVVGVPGEAAEGAARAGAVHILPGSAGGPSAAGDQFWTARQADPPPVAGERFGWALAVGDFDGDSYGDLAVGVPGRTYVEPGEYNWCDATDPSPYVEEWGECSIRGRVTVLYSSPSGLSVSGKQFFTMRRPTRGSTPRTSATGQRSMLRT